ncbi:MAG: 3-phosphoshikimate 1-carboxyvinyltransferase [Clostridia bacterium]|nr:3-phosphoshikimate 1-carboxyvinyltransferase [Clostridia bacterium]
MDIKVTPSRLSGAVSAIPSKSDAHRLLICAALSDRQTELIMDKTSEDIDATVSCLSALGARIERKDGAILVTPIIKTAETPVLDCMESGSTFRFLLPVACALYERVRFTGRGRLPKRPIGELTSQMKRRGVSFSADALPFETAGRLSGGDYELPGNVSSQYITGLLLALPKTREGGVIRLTTELQSSPYVDITLGALKKFGVDVKKGENTYEVERRQRFSSPGRVNVEGDWSNAAFFLCAGAINAPVTVTGLDIASPQGDKAIIEVLRRFGADVKIKGNAVTVSPAALKACEVDLGETPDMLPILSVLAAYAEGETRFVNAARLRLKESDRIASCENMLRALGVSASSDADSLTVAGGRIAGGTIDSAGDHRIAMAAATAALSAAGAVTIKGAHAVNKSYPTFFEDFKKLGGVCHVV